MKYGYARVSTDDQNPALQTALAITGISFLAAFYLTGSGNSKKGHCLPGEVAVVANRSEYLDESL